MNSYTTRQADEADAALRETYAWIEAYGKENGRPPNTTEVGKGVGLTYAGAYRRLDKMIGRGWIERDAAGFILLLGMNEK